MKKYMAVDSITGESACFSVGDGVNEKMLKRAFAEKLIWISWFKKGMVDADEGIDCIRKDLSMYSNFLEEVETKIDDINIKAC